MIWFTMWHSFSRSFPNLLTKADAHVLSFTDKTTMSLETVAGAALPGLPTWSILCNSSWRLVHELRNSTRLHRWLWTGMRKISEMFFWSLFFAIYSIIDYILSMLPGWIRVYVMVTQIPVLYMFIYVFIFVQSYFSTMCWYCKKICIFFSRTL